MKKVLLFSLMAACLMAAVASWARMLIPGLPWPIYLHEAGRCLALAGFTLLFFQYVLSARIKWIEKGIGLDRLLAMHRVAGVAVLALLTCHPVLILLSERLQGYAAPMNFPRVLGLTTLMLVWTTAVSAILYGRVPIRYETWKRMHRVAYGALPFAFVHSIIMGSTLQQGFLRGFWIILGFGYAALLLSKLRQYIVARRHPGAVARIEQETHDIWTLHFNGDHPAYAPGQFMFLQIVQDGRVSSPHPFTIASSPAREGLAVSVKAAGDFTWALRETKPSDAARIDMPYGRFSFLNYDADRYVFIAGGIGITPFLSMLRYMRDTHLHKEVILLWANKQEKDIAFRHELEAMLSEMTSLKIVHVLSREETWPGETGRIDSEKLKRHVGDFSRGRFFLCGPSAMMTDIQTALSTLGVPKRRIHSERFALY